jgi:hypothetical protein
MSITRGARWAERRRQRRAWDAQLRRVEVPAPFSLDVFCANVVEARDRTLHLVPFRSWDSVLPSGFWIPSAGEDYVFFDGNASPSLQEHIVLHEVWHMLGGHAPKSLDDPKVLRMLLPDLDPDVIVGVMRRTSYADPEERDAEGFARYVRERAWRVEARRTDESEPDAALRRLYWGLG